MTVFDYVAFAAMAVVVCGGVGIVIWLGDLPADIARRRNHPQVASIRALAWFGLVLTAGVVWVLAIVWAYYEYPDDREVPSRDLGAEIAHLRERVGQLEAPGVTRSGDAP